MPNAAVARLSTLLDRTATDPDQNPADRLSGLRALRDDLTALVGQADRYIADQQGQREGAAMGRLSDFMGARENARVRANMLANGMATPEQMDGGGYLSDDQLDGKIADGTIEEAVYEIGRRLELYTTRSEQLNAAVEDVLYRTLRDYSLGEAKSVNTQPSTADVYGRMVDGKRVYDKSRQGLHKQIIKSMLQSHVDSGSKQPLDPDTDQIKLMLPEYASMLQSDDENADDAVSDEAADVAGGLEQVAKQNKVTTVSGQGDADDDDDAGLSYADLPDTTYDPNQDWRVAQLGYMRGQYGDFGPDQFGEFGMDEAIIDPDTPPIAPDPEPPAQPLDEPDIATPEIEPEISPEIEPEIDPEADKEDDDE